MTTDVATVIGTTAKSIMYLVNEIDEYLPDEALVEVLIDAFHRWATIEQSLLFPALEQYAPDSDQLLAAAEKRLTVLQTLEDDIHLGEGADAPYSELALKYVAAVKYHLIVDVEDIMPLTLQVPAAAARRLVDDMKLLNEELGG